MLCQFVLNKLEDIRKIAKPDTLETIRAIDKLLKLNKGFNKKMEVLDRIA
jgi:hypothetical protein